MINLDLLTCMLMREAERSKEGGITSPSELRSLPISRMAQAASLLGSLSQGCARLALQCTNRW